MYPTDSDIGNYTIDVVLSDANPNPLQRFYSFNVEVVSQRGFSLEISKTLKANITQIDGYGNMTLHFNEPI